ncbi:triose-phosphate isomerase [archaeon CG10_big_fil_rev_8_21_14_0_10_43_11]|nr:MAG: triose-phosphate isomerase [archaeon CG10_big_fil_rev_8_21_14_0_10_43_11]
MIDAPRLIVNFKTYEHASGTHAIELAKKILINKCVFVCPQLIDLPFIKKQVFAQHVDPITPGRNTGFISPQTLKHHGVRGSLINHSEHPISLTNINHTIRILKTLSMTSIVCSPTAQHARKVSKLKPDFVAFEPPELIAGDVSVSRAQPDNILAAVKNSRVPVLVGAGVKTKKDVRAATELGAYGVLVASGVVNAKNPTRIVQSFLSHLPSDTT